MENKQYKLDLFIGNTWLTLQADDDLKIIGEAIFSLKDLGYDFARVNDKVIVDIQNLCLGDESLIEDTQFNKRSR